MNQNKQITTMAYLSLILGILSIVFLFASILLAVLIETMGAVMLFRWVVIPVSLAAFVAGLISYQKARQQQIPEKGIALAGMIIGLGVSIFVILAMLLLMLFFMIAIPFKGFY